MAATEVPPTTLPKLIRPEPLSDKEDSEITKRYQTNLKNAKSILETNLYSKRVPTDTLDCFQVLGQLGTGGYATVYLVQRKRFPHRKFALKVQPKLDAWDFIVTIIKQEKKLLYSLHSPFVVQLLSAFQDAKNVYMVLEHAAAGDLSRFSKVQLSEDVIKFLAAQMVLAIEYLHACQLVHRDVKLNNFLVFEDNYIKIADLGLCERCEERNFQMTGTPAYQAPETFGVFGYGRSIDWWAFGVNLYELKYQKHPYWKREMSVKEISQAARHLSLVFPKPDPSDSASASVNGLIESLLERSPTRRAGANEIRAHPWFSDISFNDVLLKRMRLSVDFKDLKPVTPEQQENYDFIPDTDDEDPCPGLFDDF